MSYRKTILFVDDEPNVLEGLRRNLYGYNFTWNMKFAYDADEAIRILNENNVHAVISDVTMPGKDGFELLSTIRNGERTRDIPVVILTGSHDHSFKKKALELGATDLLSKPAHPDELAARINNMLQLKSYQDEIKEQNKLLEQKVNERTSELECARIDIIWRLAKAAEYRDTDTCNHVARVGYYSQQLARGLGLDNETAQIIFLTAPLHDIGKIGIPDKVLLKSEKLNTVEWEIMKQHSRIGSEILTEEYSPYSGLLQSYNVQHTGGNNPWLKIASSIAYSHHEKWDGSGYPYGLKGNGIPLEARIVALSDVYDALSSKRPYKPVLPEEEVLSIMRKGNGCHFDPEVFDVFEKNIQYFNEIRINLSDNNKKPKKL